MNSNFSFAIGLPVFNEEVAIEQAVSSIDKILETIDIPTKIIAINDGSTDSSSQILKQLANKFPRLIVVEHEKNQGYGSACFTGLKTAYDLGQNYILFMDSDLTQDPRYINSFIPKMREGYVLIKASRYAKEGKVEGVEFYRVAISWVGNNIARILWRLPIRDFTNGFRAIRSDHFKYLHLKQPGFSVLMEEIYYLSSVTKNFVEVPYTLTVREKGNSSFRYTPKVFWNYLRYPILSFLGIKPKFPEEISGED
jgi:dolichol-phosphate mannosyltransferase